MRMTWTCFSPGVFLDYYSPATLAVNTKGKLASSETLWPAGFTFIVDFDQQFAEVPGNGDTGYIALTAADDVGGFVAAACTQLPLSQWPMGEWGICGGLYTPNEIVSIGKRVRGNIIPEDMAQLGSLQVEHISSEALRSMYQNEDKADVAKAFHWQVLLAVLNNDLFVEHNAHGVRYEFQDLDTFLRKWWRQSNGS